MLDALRLLLPALIPSWNFFEVIADSPRVEFAVTPAQGDEPAWREFRPRPDVVPLLVMLGRLAWNARWNESLFVVSCAERLLDHPTVHSENEIFKRIAADLADSDGTWLRFRIVLLSESTGAIGREVAFVSEPRPLAELQ